MAGPWEKYAAQPQIGARPIGPADPMRELDQTYKRGQIAAQGVDTAKTIADMNKPQVLGDSGFMFDPKTKTAAPIPGFKPRLTTDKRSELSDRSTTLDQFERELGLLEGSFKKNFENQGALGTLREYLPGFVSPVNQDYNMTSQRMLPLVAKALGFTAQQMNTPAELARLEAYVPQSTDTDIAARNKLTGLRKMLERQRANVSGQMGQSQQKRKAQGPVKITDDASYDRLPSGTLFRAPDGSTRRKP